MIEYVSFLPILASGIVIGIRLDKIKDFYNDFYKI